MNILRHLRTAFFHPEKEETPRAPRKVPGVLETPRGVRGAGDIYPPYITPPYIPPGYIDPPYIHVYTPLYTQRI